MINKIYVRSLVGIITLGIVTVIVGATTPIEVMIALYGAVCTIVYLDKDLSNKEA